MRPTVLIAGGGYAGTMVAKALDELADVVLVDPRDAFVNVACSLRALARPGWAHMPFFDFGTLLDRGQVVRDTVVSALLATAGRVLILGAGPVGLELAGEIRDASPHTRITVVAPSPELLPGFLPEVRNELLRQLKELDVDVRLGTSLAVAPPVADATATSFAVTTTTGEEIVADIWLRAFGSRPNTGYLADGALVELTGRGTVPVSGHLTVAGLENVYAVGDIADLPDAKMATHAMTQAQTVIENLTAQLRGEQPASVYAPASVPRILLPLGTTRGVGQLPAPAGGALAAPVEAVVQRKGVDLFTARFRDLFGTPE